MQANQSLVGSTANTEIQRVYRWLRWLTVAVFLVALSLLFNVSAVLGAIIDFHAGEGVLIAGATTGGTVMGFLFGWLAHRAAG